MNIIKLFLALGISIIFCSLQVNAQGVITRKKKTPNNLYEKTQRQPVTVSIADGKINGYGYVDLGLPSGVKWATYNIGATTPEGCGDYFAWGEVTPKLDFPSEHVLKRDESLRKKDIINSQNILNPAYDAAIVNWGASWRIPTTAELRELIDNCNWSWVTLKRQKGLKLVGPNGKSIFLPAAGYRVGKSLEHFGKYAIYMSTDCSLLGHFNGLGYHVNAIPNDIIIRPYGGDDGYTIRPVTE